MGLQWIQVNKPTIKSLERDVLFLNLEIDDLKCENEALEREICYFKRATWVLLGILIFFAVIMSGMALTM